MRQWSHSLTVGRTNMLDGGDGLYGLDDLGGDLVDGLAIARDAVGLADAAQKLLGHVALTVAQHDAVAELVIRVRLQFERRSSGS